MTHLSPVQVVGVFGLFVSMLHGAVCSTEQTPALWFVVSGAGVSAYNGVYVCLREDGAGCDHLLSDARISFTFKMSSGALVSQCRIGVAGRDEFVSIGRSEPVEYIYSTASGKRYQYLRWRNLLTKQEVVGMRLASAPEAGPAECIDSDASRDGARWLRLQTEWVVARPIDVLPEILTEMLYGKCGAVPLVFQYHLCRIRSARGERVRGAKLEEHQKNDFGSCNSNNGILINATASSAAPTLVKCLQDDLRFMLRVVRRLVVEQKLIGNNSSFLSRFMAQAEGTAALLARLIQLSGMIPLSMAFAEDIPLLNNPHVLRTALEALRTSSTYDGPASGIILRGQTLSESTRALASSPLACFSSTQEMYVCLQSPGDIVSCRANLSTNEVLFLETCLARQLLLEKARAALLVSVNPAAAIDLSKQLATLLIKGSDGRFIEEEIFFPADADAMTCGPVSSRVGQWLALHAVSAILSGVEDVSLLPFKQPQIIQHALRGCTATNYDFTADIKDACVSLAEDKDWYPYALRSQDRAKRAPLLSMDILLRSCNALSTLLMDNAVNLGRWKAASFEDARALGIALITSGADDVAVERILATLGRRDSSSNFTSFVGPSCGVCESSSLKAMRRLLSLTPYESDEILLSSRRLSLFISAVIELSAPVVLARNGTQDSMCWAVEAASLRQLALNILLHLEVRCREHVIGCASLIDDAAYATMGGRRGRERSFAWNLPEQAEATDAAMTVHSAVGSRGLFLLAYQGSNLVFSESAESCSGMTAVRDGDIPNAYFRLLRVLGHPFNTSVFGPEHGKEKSHPGSAKVEANTNDFRAIRVGFLSSFFHEHSIGRLLQPVISGLSAQHRCSFIRVESPMESCLHISIVHVKPPSSKPLVGPVQLALEASADTILMAPYHVNRALDALADLALDVLIFADLYMDPIVTFLAAFRLCPTQIAFWGHPFSSGLDSIDYFVSSAIYEPVLAEGTHSRARRHNQFSEQLVLFESLGAFTDSSESQKHLKHLNTLQRDANASVLISSKLQGQLASHWRALEQLLQTRSSDIFGAEPYSPAQHLRHWCESPGYRQAHNDSEIDDDWCDHATGGAPSTPRGFQWWLDGYFTMRVGCLQMIIKMHPLLDDVIVEILRHDPKTVVFLLRNTKQRFMQAALQQRLAEKLAVAQINPYGVVFIDEVPKPDYERLVCSMSVILDSFPFGGGVTLWDSVHCGVAFVTAPNLQSVHALGAGIASTVNQLSSSDNDTSNLHKIVRGDWPSTEKGFKEAVRDVASSVFLLGRDLKKRADTIPIFLSGGPLQESISDEWFTFIRRSSISYSLAV